MGKNVVEKIDDQVKIKTVLVSVSDKSGLDTFIPGLVELNPEILILSTGGTFGKIKEILGEKADACLKQVSDYTGQPETQGGLVKTLDFKIYLGLLTETYNEAHQKDLKRTAARAIDMVVVNLYPFSETIARKGVSPEDARGNIDIGGPTMIRASAKNFIRVASVVDPLSYPSLLENLKANNGALSLEDRFTLAKKAFDHTAVYDRTIADYLAAQSINIVKSCYKSGE
jgi:phosphoribosylaminoimidazolecarboxamide formyltransferase/IMP cyclohydrolase